MLAAVGTERFGFQAQVHVVQEQAQLAVKLIPELGEEGGKELANRMDSYMTEMGFTRAELNTLDAKTLTVIKDAMDYRDLRNSNKNVSEKKVVNKTKVLRAGTTSPEQMSSQTSHKAKAEQMNKLKESGRIEDSLPLLSAYLKG